MGKKRICFDVETPFQLFVSLCLLSELRKDAIEADLYIGMTFDKAESVYNRICELKIFDEVYLYDPGRYKRTNIIKKMSIMLSPMKKLRAVLDRDVSLININYDEVYFSNVLVPGEAIVNINENIHVFWIDDGIGSYTGGLTDPVKFHRHYSFLYVMAGLNPSRLYPEAVYLLNPDYCGKHPFCEDIRKVPNNLTEEWDRIIRKVFDYKTSDLYVAPVAVYLTDTNDLGLVDNNRNELSELQESIYDVCNDNGYRLVRRKHPRELGDNVTPTYVDFETDTINNMWELVSKDEITAQHVLISWFSTAQFSPCLLYGKEPWVIFLYKIQRNGIDVNLRERLEQGTEVLRSHYKEPNKVIVPETVEELDRVLSGIMNHSN